jgi:hypothetical protein
MGSLIRLEGEGKVVIRDSAEEPIVDAGVSHSPSQVIRWCLQHVVNVRVEAELAA